MNNLTNQDALDITLKHLIKNYGVDAAVQLFQSEGANNIFRYHGLAWDLGRRDFEYFCELFLYNDLFDYSDPDIVPLSETHHQMWRETFAAVNEKEKTRRLCYICPRGFGKTTIINVPLSLYCALYGVRSYIIIASSIDKTAKSFVHSIKSIVNGNWLIKSCFGEVKKRGNNWNESDLVFDIGNQKTKISAISAKSATRGLQFNDGKRTHRIELLILDDYQDSDDVKTEESREKAVHRLMSDLMPGLQARGSTVIALGTMQVKDDVYYTLVHNPAWASKVVRLMDVDDVSQIFENGHWQKAHDILVNIKDNPNAVIDAENYYYAHEDEMKLPMIWDNYNSWTIFNKWIEGAVEFNQEYQADVESLGKRRIKSLSAIPAMDIEEIPYKRTVLSIDPAGGNKGDYYAFCVMGESENNGLMYARKVIINNEMDFDQYIAQIIQLLLRYTDIKTVSIEKQTYMGADVNRLRKELAEHHELKQRDIMIINKSRTRNKETRIDGTAVPEINRGRLIFNEDDEDAINQIKSWAGQVPGMHDDAIDAVTDALEVMQDTEPQGNYKFISFSKLGLDIF